MWPFRSRRDRPAAADPPPAVPGGRASDRYGRRAPSAQQALDIFAGEWASRLPAPLVGLTGGEAPLFEDARIAWLIAELGGVRGLRILELGPLEAGHTFMLDRAGAAEIVAIEANTRAYLRCLVVKELIGIPAARFVYGDFTEYLRASEDRFDLVVASGVLYHMVQPVALIEQLARIAPRVFLWTHYYDESVLAASERNAGRIVAPVGAVQAGFAHHLYRQDYGATNAAAGFCGGLLEHSHWLTRGDIEGALRHFGYGDLTAIDQPDHENGPAVSIIAAR